MRLYYIFIINKPIYNLYRKQEYVLYDILSSIYKMNKCDVVLGYKFFSQFALSFNKSNVNEYIFNKYKDNYTYIKNINNHVLCDKLKKEYSVLKVYNSHILLKTNNDCTDFMSILNMYNKRLFVCDFKNHDYFWLNNIVKTLV